MLLPQRRALWLLIISVATLCAVVIVFVTEQSTWHSAYIASIEYGNCPTYGDYSRPCTLDDYQMNLSGWWLLPTRWPFTLAYPIYGAAIAWLFILVRATLDVETVVRPWQRFWLVFVPVAFVAPFLSYVIQEARRGAFIDSMFMTHYEHLVFYATPLLIIPAAMLVWFAPDTEGSQGWRSVYRVLIAVVTLNSLLLHIAVLLFSILGFRDS